MKDEQFLRIAEIIAESSHCGRKKVGAVLVREGRIISTGYNGIPKPLRDSCSVIQLQKVGISPLISQCGGCEDVIHSEQNAILAAAKAGISTNNSTMYITLSPCTTCAKAMVMAGVKRVVYNRKYKGDLGVSYLQSMGIEVDYAAMWEVE